MMLFKSLAVSVIGTKNCSRAGKSILSVNLALNRFHHLRNIIVFQEKSPNLQRTFCTHSNEIIRELGEDLSGEEEIDDPDVEADLKEVEMSTSSMFEEIAAGDPEKLKKLKLLEFEVAVLREDECRVPDKMTIHNWTELLELDSLHKRKKFLAFLRLNELKRISYLQKSKGKRELMLKNIQEQGFHYYGLSGHTMFLRIYERDINKLLINRLAMSKREVVLDCSYQEYMSMLNLRACAKQIFYSVMGARLHRYPCNIHLCNFNKEDVLGKILPRYITNVYESLKENIHSESFLDLYPKEKLVYLTPHTQTELHKFNHDDIYVIGAFVDKGTGVKASLAKAKELNLRTAKFPIDQYLVWKQGTKSLPINIVLSVLLDMGFYNDWKRAFQNIPVRCISRY